jgi:hypothetical protein
MEALAGRSQLKPSLPKRGEVRSHQNHHDLPNDSGGQFPFVQLSKLTIHHGKDCGFMRPVSSKRQSYQHMPRSGGLLEMSEETLSQCFIQGRWVGNTGTVPDCGS